jgi:hypothetical protein
MALILCFWFLKARFINMADLNALIDFRMQFVVSDLWRVRMIDVEKMNQGPRK